MAPATEVSGNYFALSRTPLWRQDGHTSYVLQTTPYGASPGLSCAFVACGSTGVAPYGLSSRAKSQQSKDFDRRAATKGAVIMERKKKMKE